MYDLMANLIKNSSRVSRCITDQIDSTACTKVRTKLENATQICYFSPDYVAILALDTL